MSRSGVAQHQPANQLAMVGGQVLGNLPTGREADDVDRAIKPPLRPPGIVAGHVAGGGARR
jgi:hypothetical protein